eukprot:9484499-Pyramimonas_sp.AAC.1
MIDKWNSARLDYWGAAVKGSSALQSALFRAVCYEVASQVDFEPLAVHWGMGRFCLDSVRVPFLAQFALKFEYPPQLLYLGLFVHASQKALEVEGALSSVVPAGNSTVSWQVVRSRCRGLKLSLVPCCWAGVASNARLRPVQDRVERQNEVE